VNSRPFTAFRPLENPYRPGGIAMVRAAFEAALDQPLNHVRVDL
jgi:hypothetical protein